MNDVMSSQEIEKKLSLLRKTKASLCNKVDSEKEKTNEKINVFTKKALSDLEAKLKPVEGEIKQLDEEVAKYEKARNMALKYEENFKKLFATAEVNQPIFQEVEPIEVVE